MVLERSEKLFADARKWKQMVSEDTGGYFYVNQENPDEISWEPPAMGYTREDGMLILATNLEEAVEDPLNAMTEEEKRAKLLEKKCSEARYSQKYISSAVHCLLFLC